VTTHNRRLTDDPDIVAAKKIKEKADYLWKTIIAGLLTSVFAMMVWFVQREIANRDKREESYQALVKLVEGHDRQITIINAKLIALDARYTSVMVLKNIEQQLTIFGSKGGSIPLKALQKPISEELQRIESVKQKIGEIGMGPTFEYDK
jgi:hypothetical protein